jgi:hypothetical protein
MQNAKDLDLVVLKKRSRTEILRISLQASKTCGRLLLLAILPDDRQLYGVEQLFNNRKFGNLELAESAISRHKGAHHLAILRYSLPTEF